MVTTHQPLPEQSYREVGEEGHEQLTVKIVNYRGMSPTEGKFRECESI